MILAQAAETTNGTWAVAGGILALILTHASKWWSDWLRDRKEQRNKVSDDIREEDKKNALLRIASAVEDGEKANIQRHGEILLALKDSCGVNQASKKTNI